MCSSDLCSPKIEARQGNRSHSQSVPRFSSFKAATIFRKTQSFYYYLLLWFCGPAIGPWASWGNNALELANQSARYIGYKPKPYNRSFNHKVKIEFSITFQHFHSHCFDLLVIDVLECCLGDLRESPLSDIFNDIHLLSTDLPASC